MSICTCLLTSGLLLATTVAVLSSNLNPLVNAFGTLDENDIMNLTKPCPNPPDYPIGTLLSLQITDCSQAPGKYPCRYEFKKTYHVTPTFIPGANHTKCELDFTISVGLMDLPVLTLASDETVVYTKGQIVSPVFTHTVGLSDPPGNFRIKLKVRCGGGVAGQQLECCRAINVTTVNLLLPGTLTL